MEWKSIPELLGEYQQQVHTIDQEIEQITSLHFRDGKFEDSYENIRILKDMRADLLYSIKLMGKYLRN